MGLIRIPVPTDRITVIHQGALGDFLLALPVFEGLFASYPELRMHFIAKTGYVALIAERPYVSSVHAVDGAGLTPFYHDSLWANATIPLPIRDAGAVLIFGQAGSLVLRERLSERLSIPIYWIQSFPDVGARVPVSDFLLDQLTAYGWSVKNTQPRLRPLSGERTTANGLLAQMGIPDETMPIVVHPGSGGRKKIWPLAKWWDLLDWLVSSYPFPVLMTIGPADDYLLGFANDASRKYDVRVVQHISVTCLSALLAQSRLYVGADSGVSHLSAVMGTPTVVIFGPTDPLVWAPRGPNVQVLQSVWKEAEQLTHYYAQESQDHDPQVQKAIREVLDGSSSG